LKNGTVSEKKTKKKSKITGNNRQLNGRVRARARVRVRATNLTVEG
jgi:hypothetical protein